MLRINPFVIGFFLFFALFSGDGELFNIKLNYIVVVLFLFYLLISYRVYFFRLNIFVFCYFLLSIFCVLLMYPTLEINNYFEGYYFWIVQILIILPIFSIVISSVNQFDNKDWKRFFLFFIFLFAFFIVGIILNNSSTGRVNFIFGPNVLYRVLCFLMIMSFGYAFVIKKNVLILIILFLSVISLLKIGSRGGIILLLFSLLCLFHYKVKKIKLSYIVYFFIFMFSLIGLILLFINDLPINQRLLLFNVGDNTSSIGIRFYTLKWYVDNFLDVTFNIHGMYDYFFTSFSIPGYLYPHNMILEFVIFYGVVGFIASCIYFLILFIVIKRFITSPFSYSHVCFYSMLILTPSVFFSGSLNDNIATFSLLLSFYFLRVNRPLNIVTIKN